jgi:hypothetical protein
VPSLRRFAIAGTECSESEGTCRDSYAGILLNSIPVRESYFPKARLNCALNLPQISGFAAQNVQNRKGKCTTFQHVHTQYPWPARGFPTVHRLCPQNVSAIASKQVSTGSVLVRYKFDLCNFSMMEDRPCHLQRFTACSFKVSPNKVCSPNVDHSITF